MDELKLDKVGKNFKTANNGSPKQSNSRTSIVLNSNLRKPGESQQPQLNLLNMNPNSSGAQSQNKDRSSAVDFQVQMGNEIKMTESEGFQNDRDESVSSLKRSKNEMQIVENV